MSWFSTWLPELPTLNLNLVLPSSIQGRFLSFVLKRTLGHFFKPGQLDAHQIDSQIGSGFVQVNDLELDSEVINTLISGLPFTLSSGSLSSATVRIPWPNPLTSTLGFSLNSLHLTFELSETAQETATEVDLASSVVSVAEIFLHEELSPLEEASVMGSLHSELPTHTTANTERGFLPGGLDPLAMESDEESRRETEPGGISLFATLIERLLSRFEFDAQNIRVTVVHPNDISITLTLSEVKYSTNMEQLGTALSSTEGSAQNVTRSLTVGGIELHMKDLETGIVHSSNLATTPSHSFESPPTTASPRHVYQSETASSSSSSLDEETTTAMSQSLVSLPPRPSSPPESIAGSMYQSALSVVDEESEDMISDSAHTLPSTPVHSDSEPRPLPFIREEMIFSSGASPLTVQLSTLPPLNNPLGHSSDAGDRMSFSIQTGVLAFALRAWHIGGIVRLVNSVLPKLPKSKTPGKTGQNGAANLVAFDVEASLDSRGAVILFLPPSTMLSAPDSIQHFFLRPLTPPPLPSGYIRFHIEGVTTSLVLFSNVSAPLQPTVQTKARAEDHKLMKGNLSIHNVTIFQFKSSRQNEEVSACPILLIDPHLPSQYLPSHLHPSADDGGVDKPLPVFDILDWTEADHQRNGAARPSYWRCKPRISQRNRHHQESRFVDTLPTSESVPENSRDDHAFTFVFGKSQSNRKRCSQLSIDGKIAPIHLFVDLNTVFGDTDALNYVEEVTKSLDSTEGVGAADYVDEVNREDTPPATPRRPRISDKEQERKRLEYILDDLDLEYDYEDASRASQRKGSAKQSRAEDKVRLSLHMAAFRLEIRVPAPRNIPRSGALIIDVHSVELRNGLKKAEAHVHFPAAGLEPQSTSKPIESKPVLSTEFGRILISHSLVGQSLATALLSIGTLSISDESESSRDHEPLRPRFLVINSYVNSSAITAFNVEIPSVHLVLSKELLDGLQYFIDDASQLLERYSQQTSKIEKEGRESGSTSLIGSRFFIKSRSGSALMSSSVPRHSETVVNVVISEAFFRAWIPRTDTQIASVRPFDVFTSELSVLVELKPEGREETVITLGVLDAKIQNFSRTGKTETLLTLTSPRSLMSTPRPLIKLRFTSLLAPGTAAKETKLKLTLCDFTLNIFPEINWAKDLGLFVKSPPGTFESVIPSERTSITLKLMEGSIRTYAPTKPGAITAFIGDMDLVTDITGKSLESSFTLGIQYLALLVVDDVSCHGGESGIPHDEKGVSYWKSLGFALVTEISATDTIVTITKNPPLCVDVKVEGSQLHIHLAADTGAALSLLINDILSAFSPPQEDITQVAKEPVVLSQVSASRNLMASVEDVAFQRPPEIGPAPDMIYDDLPTNPDYLDESFGAAAGLRAFSDDELDELEDEDDGFVIGDTVSVEVAPGGLSGINGETIKVQSEGINMIEDFYDNLPAEVSESPVGALDSKLKIRVRGCNATLLLYDGYDWVGTRKVIEEEIKEMRRRLAKIRQLVANGQVQDSDMEETSAVLFNSVYIGIDQDVDAAEPGALLAAIDEELKDDVETSTQSSWQSLRPTSATGTVGKQRTRAQRIHGKKLTRSKGPSVEFKFMGLNVDMDQFYPDDILVSKTFATARDVEILDHIKTSTWKKFLTALRSDSRGNVRVTDSDMVRIELRGVRPAPGHPSEETRLRAKILPLRLYVDQDAVDFLKKFFSFKDPNQVPPGSEKSSPAAYIQLAEIFPVDLKLDYKPRRVDYRALREGRTIELMNFFHFDGAEMTLRHITLAGVTGWPRLFEMLNDLWTPDVKATQLVDVISGVSPIRSMVNVGSGFADLVLLPISQYKKDGRIVRGVQKGATAFVKSTAIEAIKMGARLATGTQVILEQAESVLGGQFRDSYATETLQVPTFDDAGRLTLDSSDEDSESDLISKYAEQPTDIREGFQSAYQSLRRNLNSAAQTILAVPMEVYERSGNEGPVRSVIRAVPIAVLKPMIGASEAVSKTLLGLHNTLDPNVRRENEAKYKHR